MALGASGRFSEAEDAAGVSRESGGAWGSALAAESTSAAMSKVKSLTRFKSLRPSRFMKVRSVSFLKVSSHKSIVEEFGNNEAKSGPANRSSKGLHRLTEAPVALGIIGVRQSRSEHVAGKKREVDA